jgi:ATP-dependent Lhr-like helicase
LIIGVEGEFVVNSRDFYSVFRTEPAFKVVHAGNTVGEIPYSPQVQENENLLLAARIWKIKLVDLPAKRIEVLPAQDGKPPLFFGGGGVVHARIRAKMLEILVAPTAYPELDAASQEVLRQLRQEFAGIAWPMPPAHERPVFVKDKSLIIYTFTGTKINRSLAFLLRALDVEAIPDESTSSFLLPLAAAQLPALFEQLRLFADDVDFHLRDALTRDPGLMDFAKWGASLPLHLQVAVLKERYFDFAGAQDFLLKTALLIHPA